MTLNFMFSGGDLSEEAIVDLHRLEEGKYSLRVRESEPKAGQPRKEFIGGPVTRRELLVKIGDCVRDYVNGRVSVKPYQDVPRTSSLEGVAR